MDDFFCYNLECDDEETIFDYLARVLTEFLWLWPFLDGNGRMGQLIMQIILLQQGYPVFGLPPALSRDFDRAV